ncbi:mCG145880, partial [Mus musculus]
SWKFTDSSCSLVHARWLLFLSNASKGRNTSKYSHSTYPGSPAMHLEKIPRVLHVSSSKFSSQASQILYQLKLF